MNKSIIKKISGIIIVCLCFLAVFTVLNHNIGNAWVTTSYEPQLTDTPVYVEFTNTTPLKVCLTPTEDFMMNGLKVVLVNISSDSQGTLVATMTSADGSVISSNRTLLSEISVGSWYDLGLSTQLISGEKYYITFSVDSGNPYFMALDASAGSQLPYSLEVSDHGDTYISMGLERVDITPQTFGDIFYYSVPLSILLFVIILIRVSLGKRFNSLLRSIPFSSLINKYGNEIFLIVLYITLVISIYSRAYVQNVFISADSSGYLREAANLVAGNGFSYDGLAGYKTWFANWPILYPLMIAAIMLITHQNAYLASKILSMLLLLAIMIIIYIYARKDAWVYSLALINTGFVTLTHYTWSELPFMLFMMCFGLVLGTILKEDAPSHGKYVLMGVLGFAIFMTRYYGLFIFFVLAAYIMHFFVVWLKRKDKNALIKWISLTVSSAVSGILCLSYLILNQLKNGLATGVPRTMWWDDYGILTNDLITSLTTEFFHIFNLETPSFIQALPIRMQVWILFIILIGVFVLLSFPLKKFNEHSVWIFMGLTYYILFIAIRYVSSMDSFYFRFFEPATFLITLGVIGYLISVYKDKKAYTTGIKLSCPQWSGIVILAVIFISLMSIVSEGGVSRSPYYTELCNQWDNAYAEIPENSVVIFSDLDFRSAFYRPDVIEGSIDPSMSMNDIKAVYYGSKNMCLKVSDAQAMVAEPVYPSDVDSAIKDALGNVSEDAKYICIPLS